NGIWERKLMENPVSVNYTANHSAENYKLFQNYPNPFNPSTKIRYKLPEEITVSLKVYDILGNEVITLVNEKQNKGNYEVSFFSNVTGVNLASGIYFYKLSATGRTGNFTDIKSMILIK
ncbi:MAG TPA: T9SS type A sorting domain-containing protein, partial [Ignavibacteria bacterium]|nr:T9SS type A sorting domain-containing protein [Ignavibacteria bacterium]HMR42123.1 T9SS type A sorting domain-containing protein [Ignavibacteria bacterium]